MQIAPPFSDAERAAVLAEWRARGAAAVARQDVPGSFYRAISYMPKMLSWRCAGDSIEICGRTISHPTARGRYLLAARHARAVCRAWGWKRAHGV